MDNGWIKLHRKILDSTVFENEKCLKIWIWCLAKANHKLNNCLIGRQKIAIKPGQFIMGGLKAEDILNIARTTIYYWVDFLEKEGMVDIKKTNKYTIITIQNWDKYQGVDIKSTSNDTTNGHQIDTNKNDKNDKNVKGIANAIVAVDDLVYEPLKGNKTKSAFLDRARGKKGKPPMLKKDPTTWNIINKYRIQYKYITSQEPVVEESDYFHILAVTKKMSPDDMEKMILWYIRLENKKFNDHPSLKSIFTVENINKFNLQK